MTLEDVAALGAKLRDLGMRKHVEHCRALYAATRDGGRSEWTLEHAAEIASALGLGASPLPEGTTCPRCPTPLAGHWNGSRTLTVLADRWVSACSKCGSRWVTRERAADRP